VWTDEQVTTERLVLRAATEADKPAMRRLSLDPEVQRFLGGPADVATVDAALAGPAGQRWGRFMIDHSGAAIGAVLLDRDRGELEVGYLLLPDYWGRGFTTEAVRGVLGWAAANTGDDHVIAITQAANTRSRAVLDRLGFTVRSEFIEYDAPQVLVEASLDRFIDPDLTVSGLAGLGSEVSGAGETATRMMPPQ
jgi:RimJ/RimL family protein N-acetyltransferase